MLGSPWSRTGRFDLPQVAKRSRASRRSSSNAMTRRAGGGIAIQPNGLASPTHWGARRPPLAHLPRGRDRSPTRGRKCSALRLWRSRSTPPLSRDSRWTFCGICLRAALHNGIPVHLGQRCVGVRPEKAEPCCISRAASTTSATSCSVPMAHSACVPLLAIPRLRALGLGPAARSTLPAVPPSRVDLGIGRRLASLFPDSARTLLQRALSVSGRDPRPQFAGTARGLAAYGRRLRQPPRCHRLERDQLRRSARRGRNVGPVAGLLGRRRGARHGSQLASAECAMVDGLCSSTSSPARIEVPRARGRGTSVRGRVATIVGLLQIGSRIAARCPLALARREMVA